MRFTKVSKGNLLEGKLVNSTSVQWKKLEKENEYPQEVL